jgi:hypothetical protein
MITEQTIRDAEAIADELRQRGDAQRAQTIDTIVEAVRTGNGANGASAAPEPVAEDTERVGQLYGVSGQTLKQWVEEGRYTRYQVGRLPIRRETVEEYVRRAGPSLDLEEVSNEEAAQLVAEERGWA